MPRYAPNITRRCRFSVGLLRSQRGRSFLLALGCGTAKYLSRIVESRSAA